MKEHGPLVDNFDDSTPGQSSINHILQDMHQHIDVWDEQDLDVAQGAMFGAVSEWTQETQSWCDIVADTAVSGSYVHNEEGEWVPFVAALPVQYGKLFEVEVEQLPNIYGEYVATLCVTIVSYDNPGYDRKVLVPVARAGERGMAATVRQLPTLDVSHQTIGWHLDDRRRYAKEMDIGVEWEQAARVAYKFLSTGVVESDDMAGQLVKAMEETGMKYDLDLMTTALNLTQYRMERDGEYLMVRAFDGHVDVVSQNGQTAQRYVQEEYLSLLGMEVVEAGASPDNIAVRVYMEPVIVQNNSEADQNDDQARVYATWDFAEKFSIIAASSVRNHD